MDKEKGKDFRGLSQLYEAILSLQTTQECASFFADLCTIAELQALGQRLEVAKMLHQNETYQEISKITGASTATISRVNRCLLYGEGGYSLVLKRLEQAEK